MKQRVCLLADREIRGSEPALSGATLCPPSSSRCSVPALAPGGALVTRAGLNVGRWLSLLERRPPGDDAGLLGESRSGGRASLARRSSIAVGGRRHPPSDERWSISSTGSWTWSILGPPTGPASGLVRRRRFLWDSRSGTPPVRGVVAATRTALLRRQHLVLGRLARESMAQWRWREAVDFADRWLAGDPVSDEAAQLAVEGRYLSGNRSAALSRYAEFRTQLAAEAGCEPSRALQALVHRIEADRATNESRPITDEWYAYPSFERAWS